MYHYGQTLLVDYIARERQQEIAAKAARYQLLAEHLPTPSINDRLAHLMVRCALWLAPAHTIAELHRTA